jgi:hypothetical protein
MILAKDEEEKSMGGLGSGNRYRFNKKITTDECRSLDVRRLHREGLLRSGNRFSWRWSCAGREVASIRAFVYEDKLCLHYRSKSGGEWVDVKEPVPLEWTPCNFGGERPWFVCPGVGCGRRVAILYGPGKYFLCRHCYDLRYESQRKDKQDRALRRAQKIRMRLGGTANMLELFPERPKGVHHDTYMKLFWEHHEAEREHLVGAQEWLDKLRADSLEASSFGSF